MSQSIITLLRSSRTRRNTKSHKRGEKKMEYVDIKILNLLCIEFRKQNSICKRQAIKYERL